MRLPFAAVRTLLLASLFYILTVAPSILPNTQLPNSITLSYEFLSDTSSVKPLCTIFYDPKTLTHHLSSWTPPSTSSLRSTSTSPTSPPLLRILLPNGSSTITSLLTFSENLHQNIDLWLSSPSANTDSTICSASITSLTPPPLTADEERQRQKAERAKARGKPLPSTTKSKKPKKPKKSDEVQSTPQDKPTDQGPIHINLIPVVAGPTPKLSSRAPPQVD